MKKILLLLTVLIPLLGKAQTPIEFTLNDSGLALEMTTDFFVIENYGDSFVTGNLMFGIEPGDDAMPPIMGFIFDDMSSRNLSKKILNQSTAKLKFVFSDGTSLSVNTRVSKGYGGINPACLLFSVTNLTKPSEAAANTMERCRRNMSILLTKRIEKVEIDGSVIRVRSEASSDPLLNNCNLLKRMCADLSRRYPSNPFVK